MAAPNGYPSFAYNRTQPAVIVQTIEAFNALPPPGNWRSVPFPENPPLVPPVEPPTTVLAAVLLIYALLLAQVPPTPPATLLEADVETDADAEPPDAPKVSRRKTYSGD